MKTTTSRTRCFEFCYPQIDTLIQVEETDGEVVIRATRDTFTEEQKSAFIRMLAAEGFVSDYYSWFQLADRQHGARLRWLVDYSWLELSEELLTRSRRFMTRLFVSSAVLLTAMMLMLFLCSDR